MKKEEMGRGVWRSFAYILACVALLVSTHASHAATYLNLNFGSGTKVGLAAEGGTTNDAWNVVPQATNVAATYTYYGTSTTVPIVTWRSVSNLVWASSNSSTIWVSITNLTSISANGATDVMLNSYLTSGLWLVQDYYYDEENMEYGEVDIYANPKVVLHNLPAGTYDLLLYGVGSYGYDSYDNENFQIKAGTNATSGYKATANITDIDASWAEDQQYVRYTNLVVQSGDSITISLNGNNNYYHVINGLQLVGSTPQLGNVAFDPGTGTTVPTSVSLSVPGESGVTIYYTTDGTTPTTSSSVYSSAVSLTSATTIKAFAVKTGYLDSAVSSATYPLPQLPDVTFSPANGAFLPTNVTLSVLGHTNATIYYTIDGTLPTTNGILYTAPIALDNDDWAYTENVVPTMTGYTTPSGNTVTYSSELSSSSFYGWHAFDHSTASGNSSSWCANSSSSEWVAIQFPSSRQVAKYAVISRAGSGDGPKTWTFEGWNGSSYVVLDTRSNETDWLPSERREFVCTNNAAFAKYRLNVSEGNTSAANSSGKIMVGEIEMFEAKVTVQAYAYKTGYLDTPVEAADYFARASAIPQVVPTPRLSPAAGTFNNNQAVTVTCSLSGSTIEYCTNGTDWVTYSAAVTLDRTTTFQARAFKSGYAASMVRSGDFNFAVAASAVFPNGGTFTNATTITITNATAGATIQYKTNGSSLQTYSAQFTLPGTAELVVVASKTYYTSSTNSLTFTIKDPSLTNFLNINFGSGNKVGLAVRGENTNDVWNLVTAATNVAATLNSTPIVTWGSKTNLLWHNGLASTLAISITNLTQLTSNGSEDAMFNSLLYSELYLAWDEENMTYLVSDPSVVIEHLPAGTYDLIIYGLGSSYGDEQTYRVKLGTNAFTSWHSTYQPGEVTTDWTEGIQYVRFTNLVANADDALIVKFSANDNYHFLINGLQLSVGTAALPQLPNVAFDPVSGTAVSVTVSMSVDGYEDAAIYYTLDGSTPTTSSTLYTGSVSLTTAKTVKAIAAKAGYQNSAVSTATYPLPQLPSVSFSPASGAYLPTNVTLSVSGHTNASIYYTLDGTAPTTNSLHYTGPIALATNDWSFSTNLVPTMTASNSPGGYLVTSSSVLTNLTAGWKAFNHSIASPVTNYWMAAGAGPEWLVLEFPTQRVVAKYAILSRTGATDGPRSWEFQGWDGSQYVTLDTRSDETDWQTEERREFVCTNNNAFLKYRLYVTQGNASDNNPATNICIGEVEMFEAKATIAAFAVKSNYLDSVTTYASYFARAATIPQIAPTPKFSPIGGTFNNDATVTITSSLGGSTISYSTNGTDWLAYSSPVSLDRKTKLRAIASKTGYSNSLERADTYRFAVAPTTILPNGGTFTNTVEVTLTNLTIGAAIHYRFNGGGWSNYAGPFILTNTAQILVEATRQHYHNSTNIAEFFLDSLYSTNKPSTTRLFNINFQELTNSYSCRTGLAAVGISTDDYWNPVGRTTNIVNILTNLQGEGLVTLATGDYTNLFWADGGDSPMTISLKNLTQDWQTYNYDRMLDSEIRTKSSVFAGYNTATQYVTIHADAQIVICGLPPGMYDMYVYGYPTTELPALTYGYAIGDEPLGNWQSIDCNFKLDAYPTQQVHFVKFQNVAMTGKPLKFGFGEDPELGFPEYLGICGIQLVARMVEDPNAHNAQPSVYAGPDKYSLTNLVHLAGVLSDDGLPQGSWLSQQWSKVSGPGTVTFGSSTSLVTTATFSAAGTYVLRLTVNDTAKTNTDEVSITIKEPAEASVRYHITDLGPIDVNDLNNLGMIVGNGRTNGEGFLWRPVSPNSTNGTLTYSEDLFIMTNMAFAGYPPTNVAFTTVYYRLNDLGDILGRFIAYSNWVDEFGITNIDQRNTLVAMHNNGGLQGGWEVNQLYLGGMYSDYDNELGWPPVGTGFNNWRDAVWTRLQVPGFTTDSFTWGYFSETNFFYRPADTGWTNDLYSAHQFRSILEESGFWPWVYRGNTYYHGNTNTDIPNIKVNGLNDLRHVVGGSTGQDPLSFNSYDPYYRQWYTRAFFWSTNDGVVNLGSLMNLPNTDYRDGGSVANALNNQDWVVGYSSVADGPLVYRAFLTTPESGWQMRDLGALTGTNHSIATAINNSPAKVEVVGYSGTRAFVFDTETGMQDLNRLIPTNSGWAILSKAVAINDSGSIIGQGTKSAENHAFLLTPVVNDNISIVLTTPTNGQTFLMPTNILISADASSSTNIVRVEFYQDFKLIGSVTNEPYELVWSNMPPKIYMLAARAYDAAGGVAWSKTIYVSPPNEAPVVEVWASDDTIFLTNSLSLYSHVSDDGLPLGARLSYNWSKVSGPGAITFSDSHTLRPTARFDAPGVYVVRLTVSDSLLDGSDEVTITVIGDNQAPNVTAGADQTLTKYTLDVGALMGTNAPGRIFVNHDEFAFLDYSYSFVTTNMDRLATNLVNWFMGGRPAKILAYSSDDSYAGTHLADTLAAAGHDYTVFDPSGTNTLNFSLTNLLQYDILFLGWDAVTNSVLIDYVRAGGNVYLALGTGNSTHEPDIWNPFLNEFGLNLRTPAELNHFTFMTYAPTNHHPVFTGVKNTYINDGMAVMTNGLSSYAFLLESANLTNNTIGISNNLYATFDQGAPHLPLSWYWSSLQTVPPDTFEKTISTVLAGTVSDDGYPVGPGITVTWTMIDGPAPVLFSNANALTNVATFSKPGTYTLRLTASDGDRLSSDDMIVNVNYVPFDLVSDQLNLNIGPDAKTGRAAVGESEQDRWNPLFLTSSLSGTFSNLVWANGNYSPVAVTLTNIHFDFTGGGYSGTNESSDLMLRSFAAGSYVYWDETLGEVTEDSRVKIEHLPEGSYDIYVYARGASSTAIGRFQLFVDSNNLGSDLVTTWGAGVEPPFVEDYHYVLFSSVDVGAGQTVSVKMYPVPNPDDIECLCKESFINGIQIRKRERLPVVTISPASGSAAIPVTVSMSVTNHSSATIYYTIDGTEPTTNSLVYSSGFTITNAAVVAAFARETGWVDSEISSASYNGTFSIQLTNPIPEQVFSAGTNIALAAAVSSANTNVAIRQVDFWANGQHLGVDTSAPYSLVWSNLPVGRYYLTAQVVDTNNTAFLSAPVPITVNASPTVELVSPTNDLAVGYPSDLLLRANATDSDGRIVRVEFFSGTNLVATSTNSPYIYMWKRPQLGTNILTARAVDDLGGVAISAPITNFVNWETNLPITVAIKSPANNDHYVVRTNMIISASAHSTNTAIAQVDFYSDGVLLGTVSQVPYDYTWIDVPAGLHDLIVVATGTNGMKVVSQPVHVEVEWTVRLGNFATSVTDLQIPTAGLPIVLSRTYDTLDISAGDFGYGWKLAATAAHIEKTGGAIGNGWKAVRSGSAYVLEESSQHIVSVVLPGGMAYRFVPVVSIDGNGPGAFANPGNGIGEAAITFEALPGTQAELVALGGGGNHLYMQDDSGIWQGAIYLLMDENDFGSIYDPSAFRLTTLDGQRFEFDTAGKLISIKNPNGNALTFSLDAITYTNSLAESEKKIRLGRDGSGRITSVVDPVGWALAGTNALPVVKYEYDPNGNLWAIHRLVDRANAKSYEITRYFYGDDRFPHHLTKIFEPGGQVIQVNAYEQDGRLSKQTDGLGYAITHVVDKVNHRYLSLNRVGTVAVINYDRSGRVTSKVVDGVIQSSMSYDERGRIKSQTDASGATTAFAYDSEDRLVAATNALGQVTSQTYGINSQLETTTDARGNTPINEYDSKGNLVKVTDPLGTVSGYAYDAAGNRVRETNAIGTLLERTTALAYNPYGWLINATNALGHVTTFTYDANGNLIADHSTRTRQDMSLESIENSRAYDAQNRLILTINPFGQSNILTYDHQSNPRMTVDCANKTNWLYYDILGRLTNSTQADGLADFALYDAEGRKTSATDRIGANTQYAYDSVGRLLETVIANTSTNTIVYNANGRPVRTIDARGNKTANAYDIAGRIIAVTNAVGGVSFYAYDGNGNQSGFTNAQGITVTNGYDALNRRTNTVSLDTNSALLSQTFTLYDVLGRQSQIIDAGGVITAFVYDSLSRLICVTNAFGTSNAIVTRFEYDEMGNTTMQIDALGHETRYEYDMLGRRLWRELPDGQRESYVYNAIGLIAKTNFNGSVITYAYDAMGRLSGKQYPDGSGASYEYDPMGRCTLSTNAAAVIVSSYNQRGWLTNKIVSIIGLSGPVTLRYTYDLNGNILSTISTSVNGIVWTNTWDALNRLSSVSDMHAGVTSCEYDAIGNLHKCVYPNGVTNSYIYDSLNRLTNQYAQHATNGILANYAYGVAVSGIRTNLSELINGNSHNYRWNYDSLYRLREETIEGSGMFAGSVSYNYDAVGNRTNRMSTIAGINNQTNSFNNNDWNTIDMYDASGNITNSVAGEDAYDYENRLIKRSKYANGDLVTIYLWYDNDGNRVRKATINGGVTNTNWYVTEDRNPTGYAQVVEELCMMEDTPVVFRAYTYAHDLIAQDQIVMHGSDLEWELRCFGYDGHGSIRYLMNEDGAITDTYDYDANGMILSKVGDTANVYLYAGEQWDGDLGLYYLRARLYNADRGAFNSMDSFEGNKADPASLHKYVYCNGDPINRVDPSGNDSLVSVNFTMGLMSYMNSHEMGGARAILTGARGLFGADENVSNLIFAMEVTEKVQDTVALGTLMWGAYKLTGWLASKSIGFFKRGAKVMATLEKDAASGRVLFENLFPKDIPKQPKLTPSYQIVAKKMSGNYTYVVMPNGELRLGEMGLAQFENKHIDLANGQKVLAAGEAVIENGKVRMISNDSGHYHGLGLNPEQRKSGMDAAIEAFGNHGLTPENYTPIF